MKNRSVPADIVLPHIVYDDVPGAVEWLCETFGFEEHFRYGEPASGAQLYLGDAWIMVRRGTSPAACGFATQSLTVFVKDVPAHYERTCARGAKIVEALHETEYGELQYGVMDIGGHRWLFAEHARDVDPRDWGASVRNQRTTWLPRN